MITQHAEGAIVARVDEIGDAQNALDALGGLLRVPEDEGVDAADGGRGEVENVAGNGGGAVVGLGDDGEAAG